jgi:hypothetical protein
MHPARPLPLRQRLLITYTHTANRSAVQVDLHASSKRNTAASQHFDHFANVSRIHAAHIDRHAIGQAHLQTHPGSFVDVLVGRRRRCRQNRHRLECRRHGHRAGSGRAPAPLTVLAQPT